MTDEDTPRPSVKLTYPQWMAVLYALAQKDEKETHDEIYHQLTKDEKVF